MGLPLERHDLKSERRPNVQTQATSEKREIEDWRSGVVVDTHTGIILTALYFIWMKGYRPTFKGIVKTMVALNLLLPLLFTVNRLFQGNYMFLRGKPYNGSLLDFLGPYPWYILSLETVAFIMFIGLWLAFRKWGTKSEG